ncbi:MAG: hypothetical protein KF874_07635 [Rhizobiaceae bacterium]|nr:hypothetical protein [Rhizobiaceae bacterium]
MQFTKPIICAAILGLSYIIPANAAGLVPPKEGDGGGSSHSAPGPILGLGLPALAIAGGYVLFRRAKKK